MARTCTRAPPPCPCSHTPRGIVHVFAGHVNTPHARDGPHLGAQPPFVLAGNESSHAARWLNQRDIVPEWGAWCRIKLGREGVLSHNFNRSSHQPILGGGCLRPARRDCQLRPRSLLTSAPLVAAADRLFHLVYHGFSCINFSNPITYLSTPIRTSSGSGGSAYHRRCHRLHLEGELGCLTRTGTTAMGYES